MVDFGVNKNESGGRRDLQWEARKLRSAILGMQGALIAVGIEDPFVLHITDHRSAQEVTKILAAGLQAHEFEMRTVRDETDRRMNTVCLGILHGIRIVTPMR